MWNFCLKTWCNLSINLSFFFLFVANAGIYGWAKTAVVSAVAISTSFNLESTLLAGLVVANLNSSFSSLFFSSKRGDKSNPYDKEIIWKAFRVSGYFDLSPFLVSSSPLKASNSISSLVHTILGIDFLNQEESITLAIVIRLLGFGFSNSVINMLASDENHEGHLKSPL